MQNVSWFPAEYDLNIDNEANNSDIDILACPYHKPFQRACCDSICYKQVDKND